MTKNRQRKPKTKAPTTTCPCCRTQVTESELSSFRKLDARLNAMHQSNELPMPSFGTRWACDDCLKGRAIPATPEKQFPGQKCGCFYPHYAYYDEVIPCRQCGEQFIFSASEQRFWYEDRKFVQYSSPVRCAPCRRSVRAVNVPHRKLTELIPLVRNGDAKPIPAIVDQYVKLGRIEAAKKFLAQTAKLYAADERISKQIKTLRAGLQATV